MIFYYGAMQRLDWGFGNPNRTAALIVTLMIACWAFALFKRGGFWVALGIFTLLGICLVQTFSRGGVLGLFAGGAVLLYFANRPWPKARVISVSLAIALLSCYAVFLNATARYASSWQGDPSVTNRLEVWKNVPRMIADAPNGWGVGHSQDSYMQWYQPTNHQERFLNLVSLHFTLLAELNWPMRIAYLLVWIMGFLVTWPGPGLRTLAVPFGIWTATFVAGIFSHFSTSWLLYVPPMVAFIAAIAVRTVKHQWPSRHAFLGALASVFVGLGAIYFLARLSSAPVIQVVPGGLIVGRGQPTAWVVLTPAVLGDRYGKTLRNFIAATANCPSLGVTNDPRMIPPHSTVILCGTLPDLSVLQSPRKLILLNSNLTPQQVEAIPEKVVIFGEFSHSTARQSWQQDAQIISGSGDFLPSWPEIVFEHLR